MFQVLEAREAYIIHVCVGSLLNYSKIFVYRVYCGNICFKRFSEVREAYNVVNKLNI